MNPTLAFELSPGLNNTDRSEGSGFLSNNYKSDTASTQEVA